MKRYRTKAAARLAEIPDAIEHINSGRAFVLVSLKPNKAGCYLIIHSENAGDELPELKEAHAVLSRRLPAVIARLYNKKGITE